MMTAQDFAEAVDKLTGQVAFTLPLMALPGPASLPVSVALGYASAVADTVQHWNLTNPTGVAGLGWSLPRSAILVSGSYGTDLGDSQLTLVLGGAATALIPTDETIAGAQQWLAVTQPFWQVSFDADGGTWTVIDENGITYRFGQPSGAGPGATRYAVTIGDWVASTDLVAPQSRSATGWDLATITDLFGNACQFFYETVTSTLTEDGLAYTQASYLTRILGAWGDAIELTYVEKETFEYALPYTDPDPPNAYQGLIETKALHTVTLIPEDRGSALVTATLGYDTSFNDAVPGNTAYNKRTLTSVTFSYPDAYAQPPLAFAYVASGDDNPGALASVTTLAGSVISYSYSVVENLAYSARSVTIPQPVVEGVTFTILDMLFEESFAVALWRGSDQSLVIAPYRWEGRWLAGTLATVPSASGTIVSAASANLFGVIAAGTLYSFYRDPSAPDSWIAGTTDLAALAPSGTSGYALAAGDRFLAVLCQPGGSLFRIDFASLAWSTAVSVTTSLAAQEGYALAAQGNKLLLAGAADDAVSVWVDTRGVTGTWTDGTAEIDTTLGSGPVLAASFCDAAAAILVTSTLGGQTHYAAFATAFDADGAPGDLAQLTSGTGSGSLETTGMTVKIASLVTRYDGAIWIAADLASLGMPAGATLGTTSFGQDVAARSVTLSDSSSQYQLYGFDADTGQWVLRATASAPASGAGVAVAPRTPLAPSRYAVLGNSLYYMNSDQSWTAGMAMSAIAASDATSVQLLGENYLLFQTGASGTTTAWFLGNGGTTGNATATGSILATGAAADLLVGAAAFATYQGSWNASDMVLTLRRPVALAIDGLQSALAVASVEVTSGYASQATVVTIPGATAQADVELLGDSLTSFGFLAQGATISPDGLLPLFNSISALPIAPDGTTASAGSATVYLFNGIVLPETPVVTPLSDALYENSQAVPSLLTGLTYTALAATNTGTVVSRQDSYWWGTLTPQPTGFTLYTRPRRNIATLDGVESTFDSTYSTTTGFPETVTGSYVDGSGATITTTRTLSYFPDHYVAIPDPNILSPVITSTTTVTTTPAGGVAGTAATVAASATSWEQDWGGGVTGWAPLASYRQTSDSAAVFNTQTAGSSAPADWQMLVKVTRRTRSGIATGAVDGNGIPSVAIVDQLDRFAYAQAFNADGTSFSYYGCEPYETASGWSVVSGGSLASWLTTGDAHTGTTSLTLPPNTGSGQFVNYLQPADTGQTYVFGCWARSVAGFDATGSATAKFTAYWTEDAEPQQAVLTTLTLSVSAASPWTYFQTLLDFTAALDGATPDAGSFTCEILLANSNTGASLLLDELRFTPMMGSFNASVIDTTRWLPSAQIGTNGQSVSAVYDGWMRPVAAIGPGDAILGATFSGLSRQLSGTDGAFDPAWPNSTVTLTPGGTTQYDDFSRDTTANWNFSSGGGEWTIAGGVLNYSAANHAAETLGSTATPVTANTANFAARVIVAPGTGSSPAIGDGTIFLRWDADANAGAGQFTLVQLAGDDQSFTTLQVPDTTVPYANDWLFIAVDGFYYCAVGGMFLFAYISSTSAPSGARLTLASNGSATFDDLIRLDDPGVSIASFDAMARPVQQLGLIGGTLSGTENKIAMQVAAQFYDSFGRQVVLGAPQTATLELATATGTLPAPTVGDGVGDDTGTLALLPDTDPTEYLVVGADSGEDALTAFVETGVAVPGMTPQLLYNATIAEPSPLGRPQSALPTRSAASSDGTGYQRSWQYQGLASLLPATTPTTPLVYRQAQATVQIGIDDTGAAVSTISGEIRAQDGRLLQQYQGPSAAPTAQLQTFTYYPGGQLFTRTQANAAAPPTGTTAATWTETFYYDFLGRLTKQVSPDSGTTQYAYDGCDRLRFYMDADGAAASPQRINYVSYDRIGRPIEQGWIADSDYGWASAALTAELDNPDFPHVTGGTGSGDAVTGRWRRQFTYDTDGTATTLYLLGRLWEAASQPDTGTATTVTAFAYDANGRTIGTAETVSTVGTTATAYTYTSAGRLASITYPTLDAAGFSVGYYYDRLGRPSGVGEQTAVNVVTDPSQPTPEIAVRYAAYSYGSAGQVSTIGLNQPAAEQSPAFTRSFTYQDLAQVTRIADPYMQIDLGYETGDETTGTTPRLGSSTVTYQVSSDWVTPPTAFGFTYSYDGLGRLTAAAAQETDTAAFGFLADGTGNYDANGNRGAWSRGITAYSGSYPDTATGFPANGLTAIEPLIQNIETFADASGSSAGFWSWGSNNGGPSTSALVPGDDDSQSLMLGGGNALGHYEQLVLDTWLDPSANLTLQVSTSTDADYPGAGTEAAWTLTLFGPSGPVAAATLGYVPASADPDTGSSQEIVVNVAATVTNSGYAGEVTRARLSLQNMTQAAGQGTAGPAVYVQSLALAWSSPPSWAYGYNGTGSVTSEQQQALNAVTYDYLTYQATGLTTSSASQTWLRDSSSRSVLTSATGDSATVTVQNHYDLAGRLIAQSRSDGTTTSISYFVNGPGGMIAAQQDGDLLFTLGDQLGSVRALIDGDSNKALGSFDYQPFGGLARASGDDAALARFTNHGLDPAGSLIPTQARLLTPSSGRFLQVDPQYDGLSPYAYALNDPVNLVDPDGAFPVSRLQYVGAAIAATSGLVQLGLIATRFAVDPWDGGIATASAVIGVVGPYVAIRSSPWLQRQTSALLVASQQIPMAIVSTPWLILRAGGWLIQREVAGYSYLLLRALGPAGNATTSSALDMAAIPSRLAGQIFGTANLFVVRAVGANPRWETHFEDLPQFHANGNLPVFIPGTGNPDFEPYATGYFWLWPDALAGNTDLSADVLATYQAHDLHATYNQLRRNQLTLQHDLMPDFAMVVNRNAHTARYGGPPHIGSSAFIREGYAIPMTLYALAIDALNIIPSLSDQGPPSYRLAGVILGMIRGNGTQEL